MTSKYIPQTKSVHKYILFSTQELPIMLIYEMFIH